MQRSAGRSVFSILLIIAGATVMALAYSLFLIPHNIVPGGAGGIGIILNHFFQTPVGLAIVIINIPLFVVAVRVLGKSYGVKSVLGIIISSALIDLFDYVLPLERATDNPILACIFGGLLLGAGLGLVFRGGGSTGGSDIVGQVINRYSNLSTGTAMLLVDACVISAAGISFRNFELALYGFLSLYLQTRAVDLVLEGISYTRAMFIISDSAPSISRAITGTMNRGVTLLHGRGGHTGRPRQIVFTVMSKREVIRAREVARAIDPKAFIIVTDVYDVLGEGFRPRT
ncbi:MAG: YitT family protein [candidate division WOR-3 bacterium]|nr:MAG: YitT family protein [candidate division WOR-3 bacterium]